MSSTSRCPACGAEYLARVEVCADCGVELAPAQEGPAGPIAADGGAVELVDAVGYELDDWSPEQRRELAAALAAEGIAYEWEGAELVVSEAAADLVEELIDDIDHPDALDIDEDGDDAPAEVLSALFVAGDVLAGDPRHSVAVIELLEAAGAAADVGAPYGLDGATWGAVRARADALADLLADAGDDDEIVAAARALRDLVRPLV